MKYLFYYLFTFLFIGFQLQAQAPKKLTSGEIYESIKKLNFLGTVLYLAAHPDDENTRIISYFSNDVHARTAYLSITRGDGGQNLIGPEIRELLGVIRTNELLQARSVDGGEQFFTRANDFGYSKHPDETLRIWNKEEVLKDVVRVIRKFQPDIIINRFNSESAGKTHGHHTSSAMLSKEAFDLSPDINYKVDNLNPWKPKRLFFNTSWWFYGSKENFEKADKSKMLSVNTGAYFPTIGLSNGEIASLSRSNHKSQGFGSTGSRGSDKEYLKLIKGEMPKDKSNIFDGINTTWTRIKGGKEIKVILDKVEQNFDFQNPSESIPELLKAYKLISKLDNVYWRKYKTKQIKSIIEACAGLFLEAIADGSEATKGEKIELKLEAINRSNTKIDLLSFSLLSEGDKNNVPINTILKNNEKQTFKQDFIVSNNSNYSSPYWLNEKGSLGMYEVSDKNLIGNPQTKSKQKVVFNVKINGVEIAIEKTIKYKYNDPVFGEVYEPFQIIPKISSNIETKVIIFNEETPKEIPVNVIAHKDNLKGILKLTVPNGWSVSPNQFSLNLSKKGDQVKKIFIVTPTKIQSEGFINSFIEMDGKKYAKSIVKIDYKHIPKQTVLIPSAVKVVRLNLMKKGNSIAYIVGAGDQVPKYLRQIGYKVNIINPKNISENSLKKFDAVIVGIRAYNTVDELKTKQQYLLDYVKNGGNLIVQYNTNRRLVVKDNIAPFALSLSRDRVTDENSKVKFLAPDNEILNYPNKISESDFDGWVQERGLYFPNKWAKEFTPILSFKDNGESAKKGSLLVAKYGKGHYIYTGLSFFRELPAGVPGAYKLLTNLISIGKNNLEEEVIK